MPANPPELMFVTGLGRSGTTALMRVMMAHPAIVLGCERYKYYWQNRIPEMDRSHFERPRFFDFTDGGTTLTPDADPRWRKQYAEMATKWETATYVGDKMTRVRIMTMWESLPSARFVCIVRDAAGVAASWEARSLNPADPWPDTHGARRSVERWNKSMGRIRRASRLHPELVRVVEHGHFFGDPDGASLRGVLEWLDLSESPESTAAFASAHAHYVTALQGREPRLSPEDAAYVDEHHDHVLWRDVSALVDQTPSRR